MLLEAIHARIRACSLLRVFTKWPHSRCVRSSSYETAGQQLAQISAVKSFVTHHVQRISKAATMFDAMNIRRQLLYLKQRVCDGAAPAAEVGDRV